jgi:2-hydroxyglutarate dehydrogenase
VAGADGLTGVDGPTAAAGPPDACDLAVVGGGIVGLAVARELIRRHPAASLCVFEREPRVGAHQTGRSSGVVHAGIYYAPGSLKARLCVEGARELRAYCSEHALALQETGKLIVAIVPAQVPALRELERRGNANGVEGLRMLDAARAREIEPHARAFAALHSPRSAVVDFAAVADALAFELTSAGATIATSCAVGAVRARARALRLAHARGETHAGYAIFCAGAWADRLAVAAGAGADPRIVPFRGAYLRLRAERRELVRSLIYPVPDPALPFLGAHFTRTIAGEVLIGPTALIAGARDASGPRAFRARDAFDTLRWPGTWRMARRHWRAGVTELHHALSRRTLVAAAAQLVPELATSDVAPAFAGVRAQAVSRRGELVTDFAFSHTERALHVRNAPSPAATAAFAIARHVADAAERELERA